MAGASTNGGLGDGSPTISKMGGFATKGLTMSDDYFSSLLLIASEKDLIDSLDSNDVINRFAALSPVLRKHLVHC